MASMIEKYDISGNLKVELRQWNEEEENYNSWRTIHEGVRNLLTNGGRDYFHAQCYTSTTSGGTGALDVGVSTDTTAPAAGDTTLAGEITTGGLARAAATMSHTGGTNTSQAVITYTATQTFTSVSKGGTFNDLQGGSLCHETQFAPASLNANDQLKLTWTFTLG